MTKTKEDLYSEYKGKVLGYIQNRINNIHTAEDLTSDVFVKVYQNYDRFDEAKSSVSTWIFTITKNTLTDYYRTRRVFEEIPEEYEVENSVEDEVCSSEMLGQLASALEKLDEKERDVIIFKFYSGKTLKEIAERMDISYAYVKILHGRALGKLKKIMDA